MTEHCGRTTPHDPHQWVSPEDLPEVRWDNPELITTTRIVDIHLCPGTRER